MEKSIRTKVSKGKLGGIAMWAADEALRQWAEQQKRSMDDPAWRAGAKTILALANDYLTRAAVHDTACRQWAEMQSATRNSVQTTTTVIVREPGDDAPPMLEAWPDYLQRRMQRERLQIPCEIMRDALIWGPRKLAEIEPHSARGK
jgi:hypothetical protein